MPKERIYGSLTPFSAGDPTRTVVDLSWSRETEYVQLATVAIDGVTGDTVDIVARFAVSDAGSKDSPPRDGEIHGGMYMQLDRRGINELIRKLRRARDQAFGRDE